MIRARIAQRVKSVLIFVLVSAILFLSAFNVIAKYRLFSGNTNYESKNLPVEAGGSFSSADTLSLSFVMPEFIGAKISGNTNFSIRGNYDKMYEVYSFLAPSLSTIFSSAFTCEPYENYWESALASENLIYLRYYNELPFQILWAHFNAYVANSAAIGSANVKEILIMLDKSSNGLYSAYALTIDTAGNCTVFKPSSEAAVTFIDADALGESKGLADFGGFDFTANLKPFGIAAKSRLSVSQPIQEIPITTQEISLTPGNPLESIEKDIVLFGFGASKTGSYKNTDGATVFWETHGTLTFSDNQKSLQYTAAIDGGISIYKYISGANLSEELVVYNCILSAERLWTLLSRQSEAWSGGKAHIMLTGVEYNGEELSLVFSYFFDCIPIVSVAAPYAMRAVFKGSMYKSVVLNSLLVNNLVYRVRNFTDEWMLRVLTPSLSAAEGKTSYLSLIYKDSGKVVRAQWSLIY